MLNCYFQTNKQNVRENMKAFWSIFIFLIEALKIYTFFSKFHLLPE